MICRLCVNIDTFPRVIVFMKGQRKLRMSKELRSNWCMCVALRVFSSSVFLFVATRENVYLIQILERDRSHLLSHT